MAKEYICFYYDYEEVFQALSGDECKRLILSLLSYAKSGEKKQLLGKEAIAFLMMSKNIDRDNRRYSDKCQKLSENGKRGGRPKKSNESSENEEKQKKQKVFSKSKKSQEEEKEEEYILSSSTSTTENDLATCVQSYEQNVGTISRAAFDEIRNQLQDLPADLVCEAINEAALNNKRSWQYVKAILTRCRQQSITTVDAYRAEKQNHAAAAAARASPAGLPQSKQAAIRERLKKRLEETGGAQGDEPADNRLYAEAVELVAEPLPGE